MTEVDEILIRALADADAYRLPTRRWIRRMAANRYLGLRQLAGHGLPYRQGAQGDEMLRKKRERALTEAEESRLLTVYRGLRKFPYVKLTPEGEARARALCGLPGRDIGRLILAAIADKTERNGKTFDAFWLPEIDLNRGKGWGDSTPEDQRALSEIELDALPAISARWIFAHSDLEGRVYYAVLPAGWNELDSPTNDKPPRIKPISKGVYRRHQDITLAAMESDINIPSGELGFLPLPVSMRRVPCSADELLRHVTRTHELFGDDTNESEPVDATEKN